MLPGGDWPAPRDARMWLAREREGLGWTSKDIEKKFLDLAYQSDLYIGPGGGDCFDRPTKARIRRFEEGGEQIPDWLYWLPLVVEREAIPVSQRWEWDRLNIPAHRSVRQDAEEAELYARTPYLDDGQLELIARYNSLAPAQQSLLSEIAGMPDLLEALSEHVANSIA